MSDDTQDSELVRKYRPRRIGQLIASDTLKAQLQSYVKQGLPPCLLITGPTGTGKTTIARMLARYANCETQNACGKCESCRMMEGHPPNHPDYTEINGVVNRGIDEVRELLSTLRFQPSLNRRVITVDEIHGLTPNAAEALLKPLEEPPKHISWILATTDPHKLKDSIQGRAKRIVLRHIEPEEMIGFLKRICEKESIDLAKIKGSSTEHADKLLKMVAHLSRGYMRDGLQLLDTLLQLARSNTKMDIKVLIESYMKTHNVAVERVASTIVYNVVRGVLSTSVDAIYDHEDDSRGIMRNMQWCVDKLIRRRLKRSVGYQDLGYREVVKKLMEKKFEPSLEVLVMMQHQLAECEIAMNSSAVSERIQLTRFVAVMTANAGRINRSAGD